MKRRSICMTLPYYKPLAGIFGAVCEQDGNLCQTCEAQGGLMKSVVSNEELKEIREELKKLSGPVRAWMIKEEIKKRHNIELDESTIRGRFLEMGEPLSGGTVGGSKPTDKQEPESTTQRLHINDTSAPKSYNVPENMKQFIPRKEEFGNYIERDTDKRLAVAYNICKYPITQGKQGTGKTWSHMFYAYKSQLPFFLFSGYEDFRLTKLFGDKTIINGSIVFQESLFVKAIQCPSVILFDEINAVSNANTFDFHALLQNRELYIKDANDGSGKVYQLHPETRIGFAQNPKSAKYIGGVVKPSNFLGRCTYLTYPEFTKPQIKRAIKLRYPDMSEPDVDNFTKYYFSIIQMIDRAQLPVDISIRQLNNVIDLWVAGLPLRDALEDGMTSILEAVSQPKAKESFFKIAQAIWRELL